MKTTLVLIAGSLAVLGCASKKYGDEKIQTKLETYLEERKSSLLEKLGNEKALDGVEADIKAALDEFKSAWK